MKLLCAADLHLGRAPTRLPDEVTDDPELMASLSPLAAWRSLVDIAVAQRVHAVLLAGDLLDDEYDYFGTFGDLRAGVERLVEAGITVLAVAGNHDVTVLPRLAGKVPSLRLLGEGGLWEVVNLSDGAVTVHVAGWSFPSGNVARSPVAQLPEALAGLPPAMVIGLLHCDRDQTGSRYAPVTSAELAGAPVDVWLLGHVHQPDLGVRAGATSGPRVTGYLGSISPGDPGETGPRGAWLVDLTGDDVDVTHVPLAGLRYETLDVDVSHLLAPEDLGSTVVAAVTSCADELSGRRPPFAAATRALGLRLRLVGRSPSRPELAKRLGDDDPRDLVIRSSGMVTFVHDVRLEALPAVDLAAAAVGRDPLALLARKVLLLDAHTDPARAALLASAREQLEAVAGGKYYSHLPAPDLDDDAVEEYLRRAALGLIDAMVRP